MWYGCGVLTEAICPDELVAEPVAFGGGVVLERIPAWVQSVEATLLDGWTALQRVKDAKLVFRIEYEADALHSPDPDWKGQTPRSIQQVVDEKIWLAGVALWIVVPTGWSVGHLYHFQEKGDAMSRRSTGPANKVRVASEHIYDAPTLPQLRQAARYHEAMLALDRKGTIWSAVGLLSQALSDDQWIPRYVLVWVTLEALFGPEDSREMRFRLAQRLAFFLGSDREERVRLFRDALRGYDLRSKAVHGGRLASLTDKDSHERLVQSEGYARRAMAKVLSDASVAGTFDGGARREQFLDELIF